MTEPRIELRADATRPNWSDPGTSRPLRVTLWEPDAPGPWPAVLLSHGTGGATKDLAWLALPLRDAGFLVAGVDHHGNSYQDEYLPEGFARMWERPRDVSWLIDHLVSTGAVDAHRIGAAGFSIGGYTVAALLGARVSPEVLRMIVSGRIPVAPTPEFPDFLEQFVDGRSQAELDEVADEAGCDVRDERVRAGYMLAPAIAQLLTEDSLASIEAPASIVWGDADDNMEPGSNAHLYVALMRNAEGRSVGPDVGHYEFHGGSAMGEEVRAYVAADAVEFFRRHLAAEAR